MRPATMDHARADATHAAAGSNGHPAPTLYENVAARIAAMIDGGTFGPGDRLPSVRSLPPHPDASAPPGLEPPRLPDARGVAPPRPRSGFFARPRSRGEKGDGRPGRAAPVVAQTREAAGPPTAP